AARQRDVPRPEIPPPRRARRERDRHGRACGTGADRAHGADVIEAADVLITHTQAPDQAFYGSGGGIAHRLGMRPSWVLDLHNGGCAAFVLALNVARQLLTSGAGHTALIAIA